MRRHLLFICTANVCRSPIAVSLFKDSSNYEAKSAGTQVTSAYPDSVPVSQELMDWADVVFVMSEEEDKHLSFINENFDTKGKKTVDLGISNTYNCFVPEQKEALAAILKNKLTDYLK